MRTMSLKIPFALVSILVVLSSVEAKRAVAINIEEKTEPELSDAQKLIDRLKLLPHPTGGHYSPSWLSDIEVLVDDPNLDEVHLLGTNMYYLLETHEMSWWNKVKEYQIFNWHAGGVLKVYTIDSSGTLNITKLCDVLLNPDCQYEVNIPSNTWIVSKPSSQSEFVLIGVADFPGFKYEDMTTGNTEELVKLYPQHEEIIRKLSEG